MSLLSFEHEEGNWLEALSIWSEVVNWARFRQSDSKLKSQMKYLILLLWNEKDWLIDANGNEKSYIEKYVNYSRYFKIIADLANTIKHKKITRNVRANARYTHYKGQTIMGSGARRSYYFIAVGSECHIEIMAVLRGAINEIEQLKYALQIKKL